MLYETLYTFADHYLRLPRVNFGRPRLGARFEKGMMYFLLFIICTGLLRGSEKKKGVSGMPTTAALMPGITEWNLLVSLISASKTGDVSNPFQTLQDASRQRLLI